jgi:hypothetical protein
VPIFFLNPQVRTQYCQTLKTTLNTATGGKSIQFKNGYPVFEPFAYVNPKTGKPVIVKMTGLTGGPSDFTAADNAYKIIIGDPTWKRPVDMKGKSYTWHHHEDCKTMVLVPPSINNGIPHSGGASNIKKGTCS